MTANPELPIGQQLAAGEENLSQVAVRNHTTAAEKAYTVSFAIAHRGGPSETVNLRSLT